MNFQIFREGTQSKLLLEGPLSLRSGGVSRKEFLRGGPIVEERLYQKESGNKKRGCRHGTKT